MVWQSDTGVYTVSKFNNNFVASGKCVKIMWSILRNSSVHREHRWVDVGEVGSNIYRLSHSKHSTTVGCTINIIFMILMIGMGV